MKIQLRDVSLPSFHQLIRRSGSAAYLGIAVVLGLTVLVWMLFSNLHVRNINGWLPYHAPVSIFLSLVLLILAFRSWVKILLDGETAAHIATEDPQLRREPRSGPCSTLKSILHKPPNVLVVDDDACIRMIVCQRLSSLGARATGVCDGLEALLAVADRHWDIILMDGEMPFMDGLEATREIRKQSLLPATTPIVGITSHRDSGYCQQCLSAGMNACRPKPKTLEDLQALLDEFLVKESPG